MEVSEEKLKKVMARAEECSAWPVAIEVAKILDDHDAVDRYVDQLVERMKVGIPWVERTPERLAEERQRILLMV